MLAALFSAPGGATTALKVARVLGRNFPVVLLIVMIGGLFWPTDASGEEATLEERGAKANGFGADTYH